MANLNGSRERKAGTTVSGSKRPARRSATRESLPGNKQARYLTSKQRSLQTTPTPRYSLTLDPASISSDKALEPYWNAACEAMQSKLWSLPATDLPGQASPSSNGQSNCTEAVSSSWKRVVATRSSTQPSLSVSLPATSLATTESDPPAVAKVARKVRVYPENDLQWQDAASLHRRAYNLAVEAINTGRPEQGPLKKAIRDQVRQERTESGRLFIATICDEAVNLAFDTLRKLIKKWRKGEQARLRFRSIKDTTQGFTAQRCASGGQIYPKQLGKTFISENLDDNVKNQTVRITCVRGRWFVSYRQTVPLSETQAGDKLAAIDPGVRTFATVFSVDDCVKYGEDFAERLRPLLRQHDYWRSVRDKLPTADKQWVRDRRRQCDKLLHKLANRIHDLIDDLHWKVGVDLVRNYDVLLLPTFETSQMSRKTKKRRIRRGTVRSLLGLAFYRFSQRLEWLCLKYGKTLIRCNESYTSKTDSRTGQIKEIGSAKQINGLDRDVNGARGIFLRALTRQLEP